MRFSQCAALICGGVVWAQRCNRVEWLHGINWQRGAPPRRVSCFLQQPLLHEAILAPRLFSDYLRMRAFSAASFFITTELPSAHFSFATVFDGFF